MISQNIFLYGCYLFVNYTMMWMLRALWLVVALDLSWYRHMDDVTETCFLFVQHGARFWKCSWDYFGLKQAKASKKNVSRNYLQRRKMEKMRRTDLLFNLRMPKLQEIFTTVAIVCHHYERFAVLPNVFAIILLWARKDVEKRFEETVYN